MSGNSRNLGIIFSLASALCFASLNFLVKVTSSHVPASEIMIARCIAGFFFLTPFVLKDIPQLIKPNSLMLWVRFIGGSIALFALFENIQLSGVGVATALSNLAAVFVVAMSAIILGEKIAFKDGIGITLVLGGAFLLQSPFGQNLGSKSIFLGIFGSFFGGVGMIALKIAAGQCSQYLIVWGFCIFAGLLSLIIPDSPWIMPSSGDFGLLCLTGTFGVLGQVLMTKAYAHLPASLASTINLSAMVWSITFESIYFKTFPNTLSIVSYFLIIIGLIVVQYHVDREVNLEEAAISQT